MMITPHELVLKHPQLGFTEQQIGWLLSLRLVRGHKLRRGCVVDERGVLAIAELRLKTE